MKKITTDFLRTAGLSLAAATVALCGMTACTNDDNITADEPAIDQPAAVKTYQVSIPATIGGDASTRAVTFDGTTSTSTFAETERVYVYNVTTDEVMGGYLQPSDISADGKSCNLTGTLTGGTISANDNLKLFYNLTHVKPEKTYDYNYSTCFDYDTQDGTQSGVLDGAEATVSVSSYTGGVLTTTATASFRNVQSMFRFKFVDENSTAINVKSLKIQSANSALVTFYYPLEASGDQNGCADYNVTLATATTGYIYMALRIYEIRSDGDVLTFIATDADGNEYKGTKSAPSDGFVNGKYYYNSSAITLTKQAARIKPTITWNDGDPVTPNEDYHYYDVDATEITLSGTSSGYYFYMNNGGTIHLSGLTATYNDDNVNQFIYSEHNLTLDISGTNSITCKNINTAISVEGNLKLSGNGTLSVTVSDASQYGIYADSNYGDGNNSDASVLAIDPAKTTVTRSARTDNPDGTYSWTYTVTPVTP